MDEQAATQTENEHAIRMIRARMEHAEKEAAELAATVGSNEAGNDWQWHMDKLVHRQTTVLIARLALDNGMERASARAMSLVLDHLSASGNADVFAVAITAAKARAATDMLELLQIVGLDEQRVGALFLRKTR